MELEEAIKHIEDVTDWYWKNSPDRCYVIGNEDFDVFMRVLHYIKEESIPRAVLKEKIEEYKKILLNLNKFSDVDRIKAINERILELQEILTKGE